MSSPATPGPQPNPGDAYWRPPSRSLTGGCLLLFGLGLLMYLWGRLGHPHVWEPASLLWPVGVTAFAIGAALLFQKPHRHHDLGPVDTGERPLPAAPLPAAEPPTSLGNSDLDRVVQVIASNKLPLELVGEATEISPGGELQAFKLMSTKPGYFGDKRLATIVINKLETIDGVWDFDVDPKRDTIAGARKTPFPKFVPPAHPTWIAASAAEATANYHKFKFRLGVNELNEPLEYSPMHYPHLLVIGGTGAGKSVFVRTFLESSFRPAGWAIWIADGKKTDYASLGNVANVVMISSDTAEHVRLIHAIVEEIDRRAVIAQKRKIQGHPDPFAFPPWLVILDEFASVRRDIEGLYNGTDDKDAEFIADFLHVLRKGREFRVHVAIFTQDLYDKTIPGDARGNIKLIVSLGAPEEMTLKKAFPRELQDKARRIGQRINAGGRGLVADPDAATVVEFQGYYGYTPGMNLDDPKATDDMRAAWRAYRDNVSNRIRALYSRQWFAIEEPEDLKQPIGDLNALPMVNLDNRDGTPNPQMLQYDKRSDSYNGLSMNADHSGALLELETGSDTSEARDGYGTSAPAVAPPPTQRPYAPDTPDDYPDAEEQY